jgi:D-alanyl-D-alanine carboxypeptidase/D-alanyl-D-alanine-endopeptidase (penicillin-binding protein 4)
MPASTLKIVTLAAAAETLSWDFSYETSLIGLGEVGDGVLSGDLLVVGSGDPSIDDWDGAATRLFADWADQLKARGIRAITGRIIGDDNAFDDEGLGGGWSWDDLASGFAAGVSALQLNQGSVRMSVAPGPAAGAPAVVALDPPGSGLVVSNHIETAAPETAPHLERRRLPGSSRLVLRGTVPVGGSTVTQTVSVDNPTMFFVSTFRSVLTSHGVMVGGPAVDVDDLDVVPSRAAGVPLVTHRSPPLSALAVTLMHLSQNQFAETLLRTIGAASGAGTAEAGLTGIGSVLRQWNVPETSILQVDGSGLSRYNYVTAEALVSVLAHVERDARLRGPFEAALPLAGRDGSLAGRMKGTPAEGNAMAKTGSMANVRAAAGYVRTRDGEKLTFAVLANNFNGAPEPILETQDAIIVRLADFSRCCPRR